MNHERALLLIHGYLDGELDLVRALEMEEHLESCTVCAQAYRNHLALRSALSENSLYRRAPAGLERRLRTSLHRAQPARPWLSAFALRWLALGAAILVLAVAALVVLRTAPGPAPDNRLADQVLSSHVRSLMVAHLTDVTSSDQHTVKPWFDGKLDFSPEVNNFAGQGFPLTGGRLDYVDDRAVAALVYQRRLHVINVFIWPSTGGDGATQILTRQGYHLIQWNQAGMTYWVASDLNTDELQQFVQLIRHPNTATPAP